MSHDDPEAAPADRQEPLRPHHPAGHPTLEVAQAVGTQVKATISEPYRIAHATLELECEGCVDDGSWCAMTDLELASPAGAGAHSHG